MDIKASAGYRTQTKVTLIKPNPFRNFGVNPIRDDQVERLLLSIGDLGLWSGIPARKKGDTTLQEYEIACGHHRLEAARRVGLPMIDLAVHPYTDEEMIRIMVEENMTQRGNENVGTVLDSVAAVIIQCVKECFEEGDECTLPEIKGNITAGKGVGHKTICKRQPTISERNARDALFILKVSGKYADLIERGRAPKDVVNRYHRPDDSNPNILKAVSMFKKTSHAQAFADIAVSYDESNNRTEEEYIECAKSILDGGGAVTPLFVESGISDFFGVKYPLDDMVGRHERLTQSQAAGKPEGSKREEHKAKERQKLSNANRGNLPPSEKTRSTDEVTKRLGETRPLEKPGTKANKASNLGKPEKPQHIGSRKSAGGEPASDAEATDGFEQLSCFLEVFVKDQIDRGWPEISRPQAVKFLNSMIEIIATDEAKCFSFSIEDAFCELANGWLNRIDDKNPERLAAVNKMKCYIDSKIKRAA